jgi:hypothetical protein
MLTREWVPGIGFVEVDAAFRGYGSPAESSADYWRLMQTPRYSGVLKAPSADMAAEAVAQAGYATDPAYAAKVRAIRPTTPEQRKWFEDKQAELRQAGAPDHVAELGAKQAALETGWGRSAPNHNYFGIKAPMQLAQAGVADVPQGLGMQPPPAPMQPPMRQEMKMDGLLGGDTNTKIMDNPWLLLGASILANNDSKNTGKVLGKGLLTGMTAMNVQRRERLLEEQRQLQLQAMLAKQQEDARQQAMAEQLMRAVGGMGGGMGGGQPGGQPMGGMDIARMGAMAGLAGVPGASGLVQYGIAAEPYRNMTQAQQAEAQDRQMRRGQEEARMRDEGILPAGPGMPMAPGAPAGPVAPPTPEEAILSNKARREAAAEAAKAKQRKQAEAQVDLPKAEFTAEQTIKTIDDLLNHPGREMATGMSSYVPLVRGTDAYDFNAKLQMAQGQIFLQAYEMLKGGGQITQIEGEKAERAKANLDRAQTEGQFQKALQDLRDAVLTGLDKLRKSANVAPPQAPAGGADFRWDNGRLVPAR